MLLSNAFKPDPRVAREAKTLVQAGYRVTVLAWDRELCYPQKELYHGVQISRLHSIRSGYGVGIQQLCKFPGVWRLINKEVCALRPDIVHCHDMDMLLPGITAKKNLGIPLLFDAHEDYPSMMSLYLPRWMILVLKVLEKLLFQYPDRIITASSVLGDRYRQMVSSQIALVGNYQDLGEYDQIIPTEINKKRAEFNVSDRDLIAAYIGGFSRNRLLLPFISAVRKMPNIAGLIWGDGHQKEEIMRYADQSSNVRYLGWLPNSEVPVCTLAVDVIYYCLKPGFPGAIYNAPNALTSAMAAGKPVIANSVGDLGSIVKQENCGILLDQVSAESIQRALTRLQDRTQRVELGRNGRIAAERRYNGQAAAKSLLEIYSTL